MTATKSIAKAAGVIVLMNLFSRLLGFGRETAIAGFFGATSLTDAYLVAYTVPYFLQSVLGMALVTVMVPLVTRELVSGRHEEAWRGVSIVLNWTLLIMLATTLLGIFGAATVVKLTAPELKGDTAALAAELAKIMFPSNIFMGLGMILTGVLNANHYFALPAFAPGLANMLVILGVIFLSGMSGIYGLAIATLISMIGFFACQLPGLKKIGFRYSLGFDLTNPMLRQVALTIVPIFLGVSFNQVNYAMNRYLGSGLAEGSISALNYSNLVMNLPLGIFVAAISAAIFPTLSAQALKTELDNLTRTIGSGLKMVFLITFPASVGLIVLREPVVRLLFERGAFDQLATQMTSSALLYYAIGMTAIAANLVLTRAYYALGDNRTPVITGFAGIVANLLFSLVFLPYLAHDGLALANSLAAVSNSILLFIMLRRHLPILRFKTFIGPLAKNLAASLVMGGTVWGGFALLAGYFPTGGFVPLALITGVTIAVGAGVFSLLTLLLGLEEARLIAGKLLARFGNKFS